GVERLAELHDVEAALTERGADRRRRIGGAGGHLQFEESSKFFSHLSLLLWVGSLWPAKATPPPTYSPRPYERRVTRSKFFDLTEFQFDRGRAAEDRHRDLHARTVFVHFLDHAVERRERAVGHTHLLADLERDRRLRTIDAFLHLLKDAHRLGL